jgi:S-adenosylmethionine decarboxylase
LQSSLRGVHILAELLDCSLEELAPEPGDITALKQRVSDVIAVNGLVELGNYYHFFGPRSVTATVCLAESHITFHSWPESRRVDVDIFVCNYSRDNTEAAESIFTFLTENIFHPGRINKTVIERRLDSSS